MGQTVLDFGITCNFYFVLYLLLSHVLPQTTIFKSVHGHAFINIAHFYHSLSPSRTRPLAYQHSVSLWMLFLPSRASVRLIPPRVFVASVHTGVIGGLLFV